MGRARFRNLALLTSLAAVALGVAIGSTPARGAGSPAASASSAARPAAAGPAHVVGKIFSGGLQPEAIVGAGRALWAVATERSPAASTAAAPRCVLVRFAPATLATTEYPLPACGSDLTAGAGALFLAVTEFDRTSGSFAVHIERFPLATHKASVFPQVSAMLLQQTQLTGSGLAYADGSIWLYAYPDGRDVPEVLQLSRTTGAVEQVYGAVPAAGAHPLVVGSPGDVWLAGGAGTGVDLTRIDLASGEALAIQPAGKVGELYSLVSLKGRIYVSYFAGSNATPGANRIAVLGKGRRFAAVSPSEPAGTVLVALGDTLFAVGPTDDCAGGLSVWRVDTATLRTSLVANVHSPGNSCLSSIVAPDLATVGKHIFLLYNPGPWIVLYRISSPPHMPGLGWLTPRRCGAGSPV